MEKNLLKEIELKINNMLEKNNWKTIISDDDMREYQPISNYKNEIGLSAKKTNEKLEEMQFIKRDSENKKEIVLTEKGKKFGKEIISFFVSEKGGGLLLKTNSYIHWNKQVVEKIKNFIKGEKKDDTK